MLLININVFMYTQMYMYMYVYVHMRMYVCKSLTSSAFSDWSVADTDFSSENGSRGI